MAEDLTALVRESGLSVEEFDSVVAVLDELRSVPAPPPAPSPELSALLAGGGHAPAAAGAAVAPRRRRRALGVLGALLLGLSGGGVAAAAANVLPDPLQSAVAEFSERFLPFEFPAPADSGEEPAPDVPLAPRPGERQTLLPPDGAVTDGAQPTPRPDVTSSTSPGDGAPTAPAGPGAGTPTSAPQDAPSDPPVQPPAPAEQAPAGAPEEAPTGAPDPPPAAPGEDLAQQSGWVPSAGGETDRDGSARDSGTGSADADQQPLAQW